MNLQFSESIHWYDRFGQPAYELATKSPGAKNPTRTPTVKDALELDLYPSVTTIMKVLHKPGLQQWLYSQYILSALTLPRGELESMDAFAQRVAKDAQVESGRAADFGTRLHALIEWWLSNYGATEPILPPVDEVNPMDMVYLGNMQRWFNAHQVEPHGLEVSFTNEKEGFGGKVDFIGFIDGEFYVADWKTQNTLDGKGESKPVVFYPEWGAQLRAYARGLGYEDCKCLSVVLSSSEPERTPETFVWLEEPWQWECFKAMRTLWYSPLSQGERLRSRFQEGGGV